MQNGQKRLISHKISHIAKTHFFARDFLYGYYFVIISAIYIGQRGGYNIVSLSIVAKRVIFKRQGRESGCRGSRYSRSSHQGGHDYTEGYASLHPRLRATRFARAFDLSGRAADKRVIISLSEADLWVG